MPRPLRSTTTIKSLTFSETRSEYESSSSINRSLIDGLFMSFAKTARTYCNMTQNFHPAMRRSAAGKPAVHLPPAARQNLRRKFRSSGTAAGLYCRCMNREITGTHQKALQINLDPTKYGTFAEIGAGQEVARWFFRVGGAAGTIAKTMSAYDMTISDAIYGAAERYVTRQRLHSMLDHEYQLLEERLKEKRGGTTKFFVFADTVKARGYKQVAAEESHGWLGVRFQIEPLAPPSEIIIHVRMLDAENVPQQEALGVIGVNLIYAALYLHHDQRTFIHSLMDNLAKDRVEVDMIKFSGPAFQKVDNRLM